MCRTGAGKTWHHSPTVACVGCPVSPVTQGSAPTWKSLRWLGSGPTLVPPQPMASSVKKPLVRYSRLSGLSGLLFEEDIFCLLCRKPQSEFPPLLQETVFAAHQLCQLHQPGHGVHVVQQRTALRWLHCLCHLFSLWPVSGVADWRLCW